MARIQTAEPLGLHAKSAFRGVGSESDLVRFPELKVAAVSLVTPLASP